MEDLSAFVLAGGRSSRLGSEKALVELEGETLLVRALRLCRSLTAAVYVAGPADKFAALGAVVEDVHRGCGPLGAIHAALSASTTDLNFILAVDMPFVVPAFAEHLVAQARASGAVVTVPRVGGRFEPLCAVYRRPFRDTAQAALEQGRYKIDALFPLVTVRVLDADELLRFAFDSAMFQNLNTPSDLQRVRAAMPETRE